MEKIEEWFKIFNQKLDKVSGEIISMRSEMSDMRDFIEQHQSDIRLVKLAVQKLDDKIEGLDKRVGVMENKMTVMDGHLQKLIASPH